MLRQNETPDICWPLHCYVPWWQVLSSTDWLTSRCLVFQNISDCVLTSSQEARRHTSRTDKIWMASGQAQSRWWILGGSCSSNYPCSVIHWPASSWFIPSDQKFQEPLNEDLASDGHFSVSVWKTRKYFIVQIWKIGDRYFSVAYKITFVRSTMYANYQ